MDSDSKPRTRRRVLRYVGSGAVLGTTGLYGLRQTTQTASAEVALAFEDAEVELPEDNSIEDLRLTGEVTGDYNTGGKSGEGINLSLDVQFDRFGGYSDRKHFDANETDMEGTVSWEPSHSLVEQTDFDPEEHVEHIGHATDSVSYNATVEASITLLGGDSAEILVDTQTGDTATITFHESNATDTPGNGNGNGNGSDNGTDTETVDASVEITYGFEVEK